MGLQCDFIRIQYQHVTSLHWLEQLFRSAEPHGLAILRLRLDDLQERMLPPLSMGAPAG